MKHRLALSMLEVLVVITIITIVMAIAFPAFTGSKDAAVRAVCISNLRQLTLAMSLYREDNGEYPPNMASYPAFKPYYATILLCPGSKHIGRPNLRVFDYQMMGSPIPTSFLPGAAAAAYDALASCRELRQGDIPIAMDRNHRDSSETGSNPLSILIIARENGSIKRKPSASVIDVPPICDAKRISNDFNF